MSVRATIQLCTYNRARLLERVLAGVFEQTVASDRYELVLVDDGSSDATPEVIEAALAHATCDVTLVRQSNAGLARARNAGLARARGERIIFIDDDVLVTPSFVAEHLRSHDATPDAIVRGGVINVTSFERLPAPYWSLRDYSGNYFWTTNVSLPKVALERVGTFSERFREYGWEDIELGLRLRFAGVRAVFNPDALAYHFKPPLRGGDVERMLRQARAQARTARELRAMHDHWRVWLATGDDPARRTLHRMLRALGLPNVLRRVLAGAEPDEPLGPSRALAARALARAAYFEEFERAPA